MRDFGGMVSVLLESEEEAVAFCGRTKLFLLAESLGVCLRNVRDWAAGTGWDKTPPAPAIPNDVVAGTRARYVEAYERIAGRPFAEWLTRTAAEAGARLG